MGIPSGNETYVINGLANGSNDSVWVGLGNVGPHLGLEHFADGRWSTFSASVFDGSAHEITALLRDRDGCLWVGTERSGIYRIDGSHVDSFDRADGLSSNDITGFMQDSEGDLWVTTAGGLDVFRKRPVVTYASREGLSADGVHAVMERRSGSIWMSNPADLDSFQDGEVKSISKRNGLPGISPTSMLEDRQGRLWVGVDTGLFVYMNGRFRAVVPPALHNTVAGLAQDLHDDIWAVFAGPSPKLVRIRDFKVQEQFDPPQMPAGFSAVSDQQGGIWINPLRGGLVHFNSGTKDEVNLSQFNVGWPSPLSVFNLFVETDGTLWGASNRGLIGFRKGRPQALTEQNGLPCNSVYSVISDAHAAVWLYSQCGLIRIDHEMLERWWANPKLNVRVKLFDANDGVQPGVPLFRPAATRSNDGRLWFANGRGVQVVDPDHLESNPTGPPVSIEQLSADDHAFPIAGKRELPALTRQIQIEYTALSFVLPKRVRFRYRLEGYEVNWEDPGTRRAAFYSNLNPGHYRFHVIASNNDGIWNNNGATLDFSIAPAFYQTYWFRTISLIVAVLILWRIYLWRLQYVTEQLQIQSDARTAERERIARDLHDTLLQGFHGVMLRLQAVLKDLPPNGNARRNMENALDRADEVILEGRERVSVLRSRAQLKGDLPEAVRTVCHQLLDGSRITLNFSVLGRPAQLSQAAFEEIYQIAREALSNACRHSGASEIKVEFNYASHNVNMKIADNGVGMEDVVRTSGKEGHWGLLGMRERAERIKATLSITSQPGLGTIIDVRIRSRFAYAGNRRRFLSRFVGRDGVSLG